MLEYTSLDENTNILISSPIQSKTNSVVEGLTPSIDIATPTTTEALYQELLDISNNANAYVATFKQVNDPKYQFNPNHSQVYDPNHPDYIPTVRQTAITDVTDYMNYQTAVLGISSVALLSVIVATVFYSSNRG